MTSERSGHQGGPGQEGPPRKAAAPEAAGLLRIPCFHHQLLFSSDAMDERPPASL